MLKQFHEYKAKHVADVGAWHRSYRAQLAEERAENTRLREQIWEMQAHAGRANESLRAFRTKYDEDAARWERRVEAKRVRQELRFWKRLAMPELAEDDPYWSDDDDLVDGMEKLRLIEMERKAAEEALAGVGGHGDGDWEYGGLGAGHTGAVDGDEQYDGWCADAERGFGCYTGVAATTIKCGEYRFIWTGELICMDWTTAQYNLGTVAGINCIALR